jgi:preprotein translocase subunit SecB
MSETPPSNPQDTGEAPNPQAGAPTMRILTQYLKDLSFENPASPQSLAAGAANPNMEVAVDVNARALGGNRFEVELSCSAAARRDGSVVYMCEVNYAGLFHIENVPQERMEPALLVDAPYMLFPFVRQIVAQSTRDGGFAPLLLEPLDFVGMYQQQRGAAQQGAGQQTADA